MLMLHKIYSHLNCVVVMNYISMQQEVHTINNFFITITIAFFKYIYINLNIFLFQCKKKQNTLTLYYFELFIANAHAANYFILSQPKIRWLWSYIKSQLQRTAGLPRLIAMHERLLYFFFFTMNQQQQNNSSQNIYFAIF